MLAAVQPDRFHVDEALYATHARAVALGGDPLLLEFDIDKPPLGIYITALSFTALGVTEFAARVPNVLASTASLAAVWALARRLYPAGKHVAFFAVLLVALSPYDVLFAPTAFAEPQLTLWGLLACAAAVWGRWGGAGGFLALGLATKQSVLFYIPLVAALGILAGGIPYESFGIRGQAVGLLARLNSWADFRKAAGAFLLPLLLCTALLMLWDAPRGPSRSFWALNQAHNLPIRWIRADEVLPRLVMWGYWLGAFTASPALNAALLGLGAAGMAWAVIYRPRSRTAVMDLALASYAIAYMGFLWLRAFNTYDRYVHTLMPLLAILAARGLACALARVRQIRTAPMGAALAILMLLVPPLCAAFAGEIHVGGDKGQYDGIEQVAAYLNTLPRGTPVCDQWLGWELGVYLGPDPPVYMTWYAGPDVLADWLRRGERDPPCYFPVPEGVPIGRWLRTAERAGLRVAEVFDTNDKQGARAFTVYRIDEP